MHVRYRKDTGREEYVAERIMSCLDKAKTSTSFATCNPRPPAHRYEFTVMTPQLAGFLALPSPLRRLALDALCPIRLAPHVRSQSAATPAPSWSMRDPPPSISFFPSSRDRELCVALGAPPPQPVALDRATHFFIPTAKSTLEKKFLYSAPRFLNIPINTRVPEVCIIGRSNVGKSTFLNALAGIEPQAKDLSSTSQVARRRGLAATSKKAGCTTYMNAYGFGPPLRVSPSAKVSAAGATDGNDTDTGSGRRTRSQRRDNRVVREPLPKHSLILMDTPGYGLNSRTEWGVEIAKYLSGRIMLAGAVVLIDALVGLKKGDRQVLRLLRDVNVRTAIVLTKGDRIVGAPGQDGTDAPARKQCVKLWGEMRRLEEESLTWSEGRGWDNEIFLTGCNGLGVAGARLAICRIAGLADDVPLPTAHTAAAPSKIVPFNEIQWATTSTPLSPAPDNL